MPIVLSEPKSIASEYDVSEVMRQKFDEDLFLFDIVNQGAILAARAHNTKMHLGERFFDYLSDDALEQFWEYVRSYPHDALILSSKLGTLVILPPLLKDASIGIAVLPHTKETQRRKQKAHLQRIMEWNKIYFDSRSLHELSSSSSVEGELTRRLELLSYLSGCPIHTLQIDALVRDPTFNVGLFAAYSLAALLLCRQGSLGREIFFSLIDTAPGISICFRIPGSLPSIQTNHAILWLDSIASRKNILFECIPLENQTYLRLVPVNLDFSRLGLKRPIDIPFADESQWEFDEKS